MMPAMTVGSMQEWRYRFCILLWFFAQMLRQQMQHPMQMERSEANGVNSAIAATLFDEQQAVSQLSSKLVQIEICLI
jgi:hypothetical protein